MNVSRRRRSHSVRPCRPLPVRLVVTSLTGLSAPAGIAGFVEFHLTRHDEHGHAAVVRDAARDLEDLAHELGIEPGSPRRPMCAESRSEADSTWTRTDTR